ncbi:MAG TPA: hypothetical protein DDW71_10600, partial [Lactobacillus sp.]|nr:hypothetical protein [Lactobacillus sp.]
MKLKKLIITGLSLALGVAGFAGSANAATKITTPSKNNFRVITKTVKVGKVTIPANTRVYVPSVSKKGNKQYANVELGTLRYQIRHETSAN